MLFDTHAPKIKARDPLAIIGIEDAELARNIEPQVQSLGFRTEVIGVKRDLVVALDAREFDVIVLSEGYEGGDIAQNEVLLELVGWLSEKRRQRFCVLLGPNMTSADELQAFLFSVDLVVALKDSGYFGAYLQMGLGNKQESLAKLNEVNRSHESA